MTRPMSTVEVERIDGWNPRYLRSGLVEIAELAVMLVVNDRSRTSSAEMSDVATTEG